MNIEKESKILRIYLGDSDKYHLAPVYERIVVDAKKAGLAGATVFKGVMGFGGTSRIHTAKVLRLSEDLPVVIEIVDETEKIEGFLSTLDEIFEKASCGGLITMEKVDVIKYKAQKK